MALIVTSQTIFSVKNPDIHLQSPSALQQAALMAGASIP